MHTDKHRTYTIVLTNPSDGEIERLRCLVATYDYVVIKRTESLAGVPLIVGTAHAKSQRSMARLQRILPQAIIHVTNAFDFRVQRAYFASEVVTKEWCNMNKEYLKQGISTCACGNNKCKAPHHNAFDCKNCECTG